MSGQRVCIWPIRFALVMALAALFGLAAVRAQTATSAGPVSGADAALIDDIVTGSRVPPISAFSTVSAMSAPAIPPIPIAS